MPAQRRKRYALKVSHVRSNLVRDVHVLAYSPERARAVAEAQGYLVLEGPALVAKRRRAPGEGPRWAVDERAIRAACAALGVRWEVRITRTASARAAGRHRLRIRDGRLVHFITGPRWADAATATATLWHELTHAAQAERAAGDHHEPGRALRAWCDFVQQQNLYPYAVRPIEVEARATADSPPLPTPLVQEVS